VSAVEVSIWSPKLIGRDKLLYVDYPLTTAKAPTTGPTEEQLDEFKKVVEQLIARIRSEPEDSWAMDRDALMRVSNHTVVGLIRDYAELNDPLMPWDHDAAWYIGQGELLAIHRAGLEPVRRG